MAVSSRDRKAALLAAERWELDALRARGVRMAGNAFSSIVLVKGSLNEAELSGAPLLSGADGTALRAALLRLGYPPEDFCVLSGDDFTAFPLWALGGCGIISVTSNIAPKAMASMWKAFESGDLAEARRQHHALFALHHSMFSVTNPIPVKTALALMGKVEEEMRLPLFPLSAEQRAKLVATLQKYNLVQ